MPYARALGRSDALGRTNRSLAPHRQPDGTFDVTAALPSPRRRTREAAAAATASSSRLLATRLFEDTLAASLQPSLTASLRDSQAVTAVAHLPRRELGRERRAPLPAQLNPAPATTPRVHAANV